MFTLDNFYKSKQWEAFRRVIIAERTAEDGFIYCDHCGKPIVNKYDLIIHHIEELTDDNVNNAEVALNPDNVECIHFKCHNKEHKRFGYENLRRVYIVYGAPCSGKSTWVRDNAGENDLVIDIDNVYQMISVNERYVKPDRLRAVAFDTLNYLYDVVKYRSGKWEHAFIITGGARTGDRERLVSRVNADECIYIDTSLDECINRCINSSRPEEYLNYIRDWFASYQK